MATFREAEAKPMPTLACIGRVSKIGEPKDTKVNEHGFNYVLIPIEIEGYGASRNTKVNFMFRPEWIDENFNPKTLGELEGGKGLLAVYSSNIAQRGRVSVLKGVAGGDSDAFDAIATALMGADLTANPGEAVAAVLEDYLIGQELGKVVGYTLRQQSEKTDETDENGRAIYVKTQYYEVGEFFAPTERNRERQYKRAKTAEEGKFKVLFTEDDVPF